MLKLSTKSCVISPTTPQYLAGHAQRKEKSISVHDDLMTMAYWLDAESKELCWIEIDIIKTDVDVTKRIKQEIAEATGIGEDSVIICAGHTHTAPVLDNSRLPMTFDPEYKEFVISSVIKNAVEARNNKVEVKASYALGEVEGYYGNRNDKSRLGDQSVYVIRFTDIQENLVASIINLSTHPTVLSPDCLEVTADLIGALRRKVEHEQKAPCMVVCGNTGDMSTKYFRQGNDFAELERLSNGIYEAINKFADYSPLDINTVETKSFHYKVDYINDKERYAKMIEGHEEKLLQETNFDERKWLVSELNNFKKRIKVDEVHLDLLSTIVNLGELELVVIPGDPVSFFGKQIKRSSSKKLCLTLCHGNGECSYLVEAWEFAKGHSGFSTQLLKGQGEEYTAQVILNMFD